jgi:hypothetical protein
MAPEGIESLMRNGLSNCAGCLMVGDEVETFQHNFNDLGSRTGVYVTQWICHVEQRPRFQLWKVIAEHPRQAK